MDPRRRAALQRRLPKDGRFWYPVLDEKPFERGDVIWIQEGSSVGRHEVQARGKGELLVRPIGTAEFVRRLWIGRVRRWWLRLWRRLVR